ncbi:MerR family transcriptional regulator [Bacillus coahuilensis m2-6]|uniref:MerR family transcriptional regulator n=1 Tax=Bacillus coahuilensis TaxID=408580 RepID=UPI00018512C0|nr:MerR family transcriptional regulator [Bacillus coahuilensis]KUP03963.1 MerR family transcriptional regulator [Bacillus coahuilensis m2-6]
MNYTIGEAAKLNGLTISQLRYYDNQGLLPFLKRTPKGDRVFDHDALKFLNLILCLKDTGMPIKEIKQFVDWSMVGTQHTPKRLVMIKQHVQNVLEKVREMEENVKKIRQKIARLESEIQR